MLPTISRPCCDLANRSGTKYGTKSNPNSNTSLVQHVVPAPMPDIITDLVPNLAPNLAPKHVFTRLGLVQDLVTGIQSMTKWKKYLVPCLMPDLGERADGRACGWASVPVAMLHGHGQWPWPIAMANNHWPMAIGPWPWANRYDQWAWPVDIASSHGKWH